MFKSFTLFSFIALLSLTISCSNQDPVSPESNTHNHGEALAKKSQDASTIDYEKIERLVNNVNKRFEAAGSDIRLDGGWFFTIGKGTDPYMRLRTGSRWTYLDVTYVLDESDYPKYVPFSEVNNAMVNSFDTWNNIENSNIYASKVEDDEKNYDILDGMIYDENGECIDIVDLEADNLISYNPETGGILLEPMADIVVGGWLDKAYFSECLGSASIIGVTWTFSQPDFNGDNYRDRVYVEQYYNSGFEWTTERSIYLDFNAPIDIETIALHENGHAHGLGHFGGPVNKQPFSLKPNGRVFNPEAVMNPFYLGGEDRELFPTDEAGILTMYAR